MTKIYLIRHAEAEGNIYRRAHGHYNGLVTLNGYKQMELLRERFENEHIDAIYTSDLSRAATTSLALAEPRGMKPIATQALREVDLGEWEDTTWGDIEYYDFAMNSYFNRDPRKWKVKGSEYYEDVATRMFDCISSAALTHDGGAIAVFSHGFAIRMFLCRVLGLRSDKTEEVPYYDNTAVTLLTFDNGCFTIEFAGDNSHIKGGNSTLENQTWWKSQAKRKSENLRFVPLDEVMDESVYRSFEAKADKSGNADVQYGALLTDEPVGVIGLDTLKDADESAGWLSYMYVLPQYRSNTFGTQMLGLAVSDFRKLRKERIRMEIPAGSTAIDFLKKFGFEAISTTETSCLMEKDIGNELG